jgi:hypothetical protein
MTDARRWAKTARQVEPNREWQEAAEARYERFRQLTEGALEAR